MAIMASRLHLSRAITCSHVARKAPSTPPLSRAPTIMRVSLCAGHATSSGRTDSPSQAQPVTHLPADSTDDSAPGQGLRLPHSFHSPKKRDNVALSSAVSTGASPCA